MNHKRRIIHVICFEVGALVLLVAILSPLFELGYAEVGMIGIVLSLITVGLLYVYNILFDQALLKRTGSVVKSMKARVVHALLFEASLIVIFLPLIMWWLDLNLVEALLIEAAGVTFMVVYTFVFHWVVERFIYQVPEKN